MRRQLTTHLNKTAITSLSPQLLASGRTVVAAARSLDKARDVLLGSGEGKMGLTEGRQPGGRPGALFLEEVREAYGWAAGRRGRRERERGGRGTGGWAWRGLWRRGRERGREAWVGVERMLERAGRGRRK